MYMDYDKIQYFALCHLFTSSFGVESLGILKLVVLRKELILSGNISDQIC